MTSATIVTLADGDATGTESTATIDLGAIAVGVGETPVIVLVDGAP